MIYLLLLFFILLLYFSYKLFDNDIISPAFVLVLGYIFSILCAAANINYWGYNLHLETLCVLVYGTLLFVVTAFIVKNIMKKYEPETQQLQLIKYNKKYVKWFCCFQVLCFILWICYVAYIVSSLRTFNSFSEMMLIFRNWSSFDTNWINNYYFVFFNQINTVAQMAALFFSYIYINNIVVEKTNYKDKLLPIVILLSFCQCLLSGGRLGIIFVIIDMFMIFILLNKKYKNKIFKITFKVVFLGIIFLLVGAISFYFVKALVGRGANNNVSINDIFHYITMYVGGPVPLLDMFLQNPPVSSNIFGKETFYNIIFNFIRLGIIDIQPYIIHLEFHNSVTGVLLGNIYTAYRSYLYDFGFIGLTVLPVIFSAIVNWIYYYILYTMKSAKILSTVIFVYSLAFPFIFFDFVRCFFFSSFLSLTVVKQIIILVCLSCIFVKAYRQCLFEKIKNYLIKKKV